MLRKLFPLVLVLHNAFNITSGSVEPLLLPDQFEAVVTVYNRARADIQQVVIRHDYERSLMALEVVSQLDSPIGFARVIVDFKGKQLVMVIQPEYSCTVSALDRSSSGSWQQLLGYNPLLHLYALDGEKMTSVEELKQFVQSQNYTYNANDSFYGMPAVSWNFAYFATDLNPQSQLTPITVDVTMLWSQKTWTSVSNALFGDQFPLAYRFLVTTNDNETNELLLSFSYVVLGPGNNEFYQIPATVFCELEDRMVPFPTDFDQAYAFDVEVSFPQNVSSVESFLQQKQQLRQETLFFTTNFDTGNGLTKTVYRSRNAEKMETVLEVSDFNNGFKFRHFLKENQCSAEEAHEEAAEPFVGNSPRELANFLLLKSSRFFPVNTTRKYVHIGKRLVRNVEANVFVEQRSGWPSKSLSTKKNAQFSTVWEWFFKCSDMHETITNNINSNDNDNSKNNYNSNSPETIASCEPVQMDLTAQLFDMDSGQFSRWTISFSIFNFRGTELSTDSPIEIVDCLAANGVEGRVYQFLIAYDKSFPTLYSKALSNAVRQKIATAAGLETLLRLSIQSLKFDAGNVLKVVFVIFDKFAPLVSNKSPSALEAVEQLKQKIDSDSLKIPLKLDNNQIILCKVKPHSLSEVSTQSNAVPSYSTSGYSSGAMAMLAFIMLGVGILLASSVLYLYRRKFSPVAVRKDFIDLFHLR